jgi:Xaa-Pro aminopeptidase
MSDMSNRLAELRAELAQCGVDGFVIPRADEHQSEYVAACDERLRWISGFSGSAGVAVVTQAEAVLFTDGRYTIQAARELPAGFWQVQASAPAQPAEWLGARLSQGAKVGFDPRLHRPAEIAAMQTHGLVPCPLGPNPIDRLWHDRPAPPMARMRPYPLALAGESLPDKQARVWQSLAAQGLDGLVISAPENLAWITNTRGGDVPMVPITFGYGLLLAEGLKLYVAPDKIAADTAKALAADGIALAPPEAMDFAGLSGRHLRFDVATASVALLDAARAAGVVPVPGPDPITALKAAKNPVEIAGMRAANLRDAVALVRFLHWFARERPAGATEWDAAEVLAGFRAAINEYRGPCFATISAAGESAALAHYKTDPKTARRIGKDEIYLCDSGGHYADGTTDVTRVTVAGVPTPEMRLRYTQVLRGHIALLRQRFPVGLDGAQLDPLARQFLWHDGVDFAHGTGHGVGHYLSVHEGPASISQRGRGVALCSGMVLSIEPGFYKPDAYGIRIENLALVVETGPGLFAFENLTWVPYERALIALEALSPDEIGWIDAYHAQVAALIAPHLAPDVRDWLAQMTQPLAG